MNLRKYLSLLLLLLPVALQAQTFTKAQLEQFMSLPREQQEALARQFGVDLSSIDALSTSGRERPEQVRVVEPLNQNRGEGRAQVSGPGENGLGKDEGQSSGLGEDRSYASALDEAHDKASNLDQDCGVTNEQGDLRPYGYDLFAGSPVVALLPIFIVLMAVLGSAVFYGNLVIAYLIGRMEFKGPHS